VPEGARPRTQEKQVRKTERASARRDFEALTARRMQAADMFRRGKRPVDVDGEGGLAADKKVRGGAAPGSSSRRRARSSASCPR